MEVYSMVDRGHPSVVRDSLLLHFRTADDRPDPEQDTHLYFEDYVRDWLDSGEGVRAAGGDYSMFLHGVIVAINDWLVDPSFADHDPLDGEGERFERRLRGVLRPHHDPDGPLGLPAFRYRKFLMLSGRGSFPA
jgi:hypothetical protein